MHTTSLTCSVLWTLAAVTARSTCDNCDLGCDRSGLTRAGSAEEQERNALQRDTESPRHRDTRRDGSRRDDVGCQPGSTDDDFEGRATRPRLKTARMCALLAPEGEKLRSRRPSAQAV
eukprot:564356-Rhodomonas_salina.2